MNSIELVRVFAPILHFHPEESTHCCFPSRAAETVREKIGNDRLVQRAISKDYQKLRLGT